MTVSFVKPDTGHMCTAEGHGQKGDIESRSRVGAFQM